jgi:uncharacterized protein YjbI with pentapeptide repeats
MGARFRSWWQQIKNHPVATVLIALLAVVIVLIILISLGYSFNWGWTGLGPYIIPPHPKDSDFQRGKTLWDWLQLLIIPLALAVIAIFFNRTERKNEQRIATDNQQEAALQGYINEVSELLLERNLRKSDVDAEVRIIARVRTLTVLPRLDKARKRNVLIFLYESGLIEKGKRIVDLDGADLSSVDLFYMNLSGADLSKANLREANLYHANLSGANLILTVLTAADLSNADLNGANLEKAFLIVADLSFANLSRANLQGTILKGTNLRGTNATSKQLDKATFFEGVTMPDGSIHA